MKIVSGHCKEKSWASYSLKREYFQGPCIPSGTLSRRVLMKTYLIYVWSKEIRKLLTLEQYTTAWMDQPAIRVSIFHFFPNTNNNYYYYLYFSDLQNFNRVLASCFPRRPHPMIPTNTGSLFGISCSSLDDWGFNENSIS